MEKNDLANLPNATVFASFLNRVCAGTETMEGERTRNIHTGFFSKASCVWYTIRSRALRTKREISAKIKLVSCVPLHGFINTGYSCTERSVSSWSEPARWEVQRLKSKPCSATRNSRRYVRSLFPETEILTTFSWAPIVPPTRKWRF